MHNGRKKYFFGNDWKVIKNPSTNNQLQILFFKNISNTFKIQVHSASNTVFQEYFKYIKNSSSIQRIQGI